MSKIDCIQKEGSYTKNLSNGKYEVTLDNQHKVICTIAGKMQRNKIMINPGDRVLIEISGYDLDHGRITRRIKEKK